MLSSPTNAGVGVPKCSEKSACPHKSDASKARFSMANVDSCQRNDSWSSPNTAASGYKFAEYAALVGFGFSARTLN